VSALLQVRDLGVRYAVRGGRVDVLNGVSLEVGSGETLAIVGESGSGKTTLALALCGLVPVSAGEIRILGSAIGRDRFGRLQPDRSRLALMFQDPVGSLSPRMTVRRALAEPFLIHGESSGDADRKALELLSRVGLGAEFADRYPHQLSGGQARRIGLARALALRPAILLADEPTAGLDVSIQGEVLNLLHRLQREMGLGILVITHNLSVVRHVADRVAIMYLGRIVEWGGVEEVFGRPRHPYTAALLSANPSPDPDDERPRIELHGEVPGLLHRPSGCELHTRCPRSRPECRVTFPPATGSEGARACHCHFPIG